MSTNPPGDAEATRRLLIRQRDKYWKGLSKRIRGLALGVLVLVWGLFAEGKDKSALAMSRPEDLTLLAIGAGAVLVVGLDLLEYLFGLQYRRSVIGDSGVSETFQYERWENRMRMTKLILGLLTVVSLCILVAVVLLSSVLRAAGPEQSPYAGKWCGGSGGMFMCLQIVDTIPSGRVRAAMSYAGRKGWLTCSESVASEAALRLQCGKATVSAKLVNRDRLGIRLVIGSYADERVLARVTQDLAPAGYSSANGSPAMVKVGGSFSPMPSPTLDGAQFTQMLDPSNGLHPVPLAQTNNQNPITCKNASTGPSGLPADRNGVSTAELFATPSPSPARTQLILDRIADPAASHFFNTDCVSCHTDTQRALALLGRRTIPGIDSSLLQQEGWNVRNFGWSLQGKPSVTRRTAAETAAVVAFINSTMLGR